MVRTLPYGSDSRLDTGRILAYAAVVAVHAFAFLLLLVPLAAPKLEIAAPEPPFVDRYEPIIAKTPPKPPEIVKPVQPKPQPVQPRTERRILPETPVPASDPVIVDNGALAADPVADSAATADFAPPSGPISVSSLAYVDAPAPKYPREAMTAGIEGTVVLKVLVDVDGTPLEVAISTGSGNRLLDRAALNAVRNWRFQPATQDGRAVQAYGLVPIVFSMH